MNKFGMKVKGRLIEDDCPFDFTVVSFNILADCHIELSDLPYCPIENIYLRPEQSEPSARQIELSKMIDKYPADIFCFQEVEPKFLSSLERMLPSSPKGYESIYLKKTMRTEEGVAIFFKSDRWELIENEEHAFVDLLSESYQSIMEKMDLETLERDNVLLLSCLRCKRSGKCIVVGNTHLLFQNLSFPDIQVLQASLFIWKLKDFAAKITTTLGLGSVPCLLCGDFNSPPAMPVYQLITNGELDCTQLEMAFTHRYVMSDSKKDVCPQLGHELESTCQDINASLPLDYIFFTSELEVLCVWEPPSHQEFFPGGPRIGFPSDHLPIKAKFKM